MTRQKPLSPFLKELVKTKALPEYVAWILNRLPEVKQQIEAVDDWRYRLDGPAKEIVAEYEKMAPSDPEPYPIELYVDQNRVVIVQGYLLNDEPLDDYINGLRRRLEEFLHTTPCDFCKKPLIGDSRHFNCEIPLRYQRWCDDSSQRIQKGIDITENEDLLREYESQLQIYLQACQTGKFADGTSWDTPWEPKHHSAKIQENGKNLETHTN